jgi:hypothetical protein
VLSSFTFFIDDFLNTDFVDFNAYVYAWVELNGRATGTALFASDRLSTTNNHGLDGFETITIETGNLTLAADGSYLLFFSTSNQFDGISGTSRSSYRTNDAHSGSHLVFANNGSNFGLLTSNT